MQPRPHSYNRPAQGPLFYPSGAHALIHSFDAQHAPFLRPSIPKPPPPALVNPQGTRRDEETIDTGAGEKGDRLDFNILLSALRPFRFVHAFMSLLLGVRLPFPFPLPIQSTHREEETHTVHSTTRSDVVVVHARHAVGGVAADHVREFGGHGLVLLGQLCC